MSGKRGRSRWLVLLLLTGVGLGAVLLFRWQPLARAGDPDEEPLPQEEQPGWFIYWETYDEPGDNEPIDAHPDEPANGGQRIFPGKITYEDAHADKRRLVFAVVEFTEETEPPPEGTKMWFRLWDVDDPSADAPPIDTRPEADPGENGPDNEDSSWAMAGVAQQNGMILVQVGTIRRFDRLDVCDNKHCKVAVRVGMQPGDNWRFCAAKEEDEAALRGMTQNQADRWTPPPRVAESRMLTTWRKLHLELDSMEFASDNPVIDKKILEAYPLDPGMSYAVVDHLCGDEGRYEGGIVWYPDILDIVDNLIGTDPTTLFLFVKGDITPYKGWDVGFVDDDAVIQPRTADWSLFNEKFAPAYIEAAEEEGEGVTDLDLSFEPMLQASAENLFATFGDTWDHHNPSADYWISLIVSCYQAKEVADGGGIKSSVDGDPDSYYHYDPDLDLWQRGDSDLLCGATVPPTQDKGQNISAVFLEVCREREAWRQQAKEQDWPEMPFGFDMTATEKEKMTVVHELGWVFGWDVNGPSGTPMAWGAPLTATFNEDQITCFRTSEEIEK